MERKGFWFVCLFMLVMAICTGCGSFLSKEKYIDFKKVEAPPDISAVDADSQALRVAISSVLLPQETIMHYRAIANFLGWQVNRPVILIQRKSYAEIALLLLNGGADIAFFSSGEYATYSGFEEIEMLAAQQRLGVPYYQGYIVVAKDSGINDVADLKGKIVAFTDPLSYSGYTFLVQMLRQKNETPETFFGRYMYTYSHDKSFRAVANKVVDAAPVTSIVYERAKQKQPELAEAVKIIAVSPPAGIGPVVAGKSVSQGQREILRKALLTMHENPDMRPALQGLSIDRFVPPQPELYEPIRRMLREKRAQL
ncbi:phosphate/phosphite/phosphonate ABC transporter substrate-binding protein [Sporomusa acidovorans]|uniref:Phosphite transport system-binding protein PtxB n=1 Tax=Sporomusa acidovorans (strain ATCC 49682 / DSM 3132 / Mol) TaxID=1123286 RepID=A0ABZ3J956_SPOA4|nr:phosphate/phosphite/phosphonate ABC transporter substrate-binding protein [Sporomusa acidovorans]OZC16263.1 phosphate-import protein PhnD precursor [Sporomusa acidovorans DSM 3132]SDE33205.1 phosphonate transport system substrate-binding protein [Sporomusa acidovorans]